MKNLNIKSLIGLALQNWGGDVSWNAIWALRIRGSPEMLACIRKLFLSRNWRKRALALQIASQLRYASNKKTILGSVEFALAETQTLLYAGLSDMHREVICAAISGFGHRPWAGALEKLLTFTHHPNAEIRFSLAFALGRYQDPDATEALLLLAEDSADDVRNWATFGIGTLHEADTPEIRERLWLNLQDRCESVVGEALVGLAQRKDQRIVPLLIERLGMNCKAFELETAQLLSTSRLLPKLELIKNNITPDEEIDSFWYQSLLSAIDAVKQND